MLIIHHNSKFLAKWRNLETFLSFTSCFVYAWIAHFGIHKEHETFIVVIETIFAMQILSKFFTPYFEEGSVVPITNHWKICKYYLLGDFWFDFVPVIPFFAFYDNSHEKFWRMLFLIKQLRITRGLKCINLMLLMHHVKEYFNNRMLDIIENDKILAEDKYQDNNNISLLIEINLWLKVAKLLFIIAVMSYYIGLIFFIYQDLIHELYRDFPELFR